MSPCLLSLPLTPLTPLTSRLLQREQGPLVHPPGKPRGRRSSIDELAVPHGAVAAALLQQAPDADALEAALQGSPSRRRASSTVRLDPTS